MPSLVELLLLGKLILQDNLVMLHLVQHLGINAFFTAPR